jgi:tetratricopeptide (TPR) repeat protein
LQRQGLINMWYDRDISAGKEWEHEISQHLNTAQIILLLVSPDFMNSDYCYSIEMQRAIERDEMSEAKVIPVILRPVYWQGILGKLQALPTDAKPVTDPDWHNLDSAFYNVAEGIRKVVNDFLVKQYLIKAEELYLKNLHDVALNLYEEIISISPNCVDALAGKGASLWCLHKDMEALVAFDRAISIDPHDPYLYNWKAKILQNLKKFKKALNAIDQAIRWSLDSDEEDIAEFYEVKGFLLERLNRSEEALNAYDKARQLLGKDRPSSSRGMI